MSEWISVKDRLPEEMVPVIVATDEGDVWMAWISIFPIDESIEWHSQDEIDGTITHWMPLPAPPIDTDRKDK